MSVPGGRSPKFEIISNKRCQYHGGESASRCMGRFAKFELILTTRCQYQRIDLPAYLGVDLPNLNSSWPLDVLTRGVALPAYLGSRSAKFELILPMRCHYWEGIGLSADLGVDMPNLNSSWPQDVSTGRLELPVDLGVELPNLNSSWPQDVHTRGVVLPADLGIDLPNLNSSWLSDVSTRG